MKAAVLRETGTPLSIEEVHVDPPQRGEVEIAVEAAGVCHSDLHYMTGDLRGRLPAVLGHEGVGIVKAVGIDVTRVRPGDRVVMTWRPRCGDCEFCTSGRPGLCVLGRVQGETGGLSDGTSRLTASDGQIHHLMGVSCFAERCVLSERSVIPIPKSIPAEVAAVVGCAVVTGVGAVLNLVAQAAAHPVVVIGAGGVGLSTVMGLELIGAGPIVVADNVASRLTLARELGATHTVDVTQESLPEVLADVAPSGVQWAVDAVGSSETMERAFEALRPTGTLVAVGLGAVGNRFSVPLNVLVQQERRIVGSIYGSSNPVLQIPQILDLYHRGRLPLDRLIGRSFPLEKINDAYASLSSGDPGRSIVFPGV